MSGRETSRLGGRPQDRAPRRRVFRRGPWENAATAVIALGVFMLTQPFLLQLFSYSFTVILIGTIGYAIVSHFPD